MPIFDLHSHFSFKPANSAPYDEELAPDPDHWRERFKPKKEFAELTNLLDKTVVKTSQLNGNAATQGGFRVICNGLYPLERGFIAGLLTKSVATLTGHSLSTIREIHHRKRSYFYILDREYQNLLTNQNKKLSEKGNYYKLVKSYEEIVKALEKDPDTLCILNSVEGAHAFADDLFTPGGYYVNQVRAENKFKRQTKPRDGSSYFEKYIDAICHNIDKVKTQWSHPPFFVTLSHHYYNHLAGHAPSIGSPVDFIANQHGGTLDEKSQGPEFDTISYFFLGIQRWGYKVVQQLLSRKNMEGNRVRRMLIDVKHMSPQARVDYYKAVDMMEYQLNDRIPIIFSHCGVAGRASLEETIAHEHALLNSDKESSKYFYDGVINIFDDEIKRIIQSDGLIGLMIDERRIMGYKIPVEAEMTMNTFKDISKRSRKAILELSKLDHKLHWGKIKPEEYEAEAPAIKEEIKEHGEKLKKAYFGVFFRQIFHIIEVSGKGKQAWDHITIGTDYDGVINPIDIYMQSSDMATLRSDLVEFWRNATETGSATKKALYKKYRFNRSPEHWIDKLLWSNGLNFLKKYYNDEYLLDGMIPQKGWVLDEEDLIA